MWSDDTKTDTGGKQDLSMAKNSSVEKIVPSESHGGRQFAYGDEHGGKATRGGVCGVVMSVLVVCVLGSEQNIWKVGSGARWGCF